MKGPGAAPVALRPGVRADIQGIRGLAVLLVVAFHVRDLVPGGYIGVDVFFVVSGFVITTMLRAQLRSTGSVSIRSFFARRVRRLLPMLALTLTLTSVLGVALLSPLGASAVTSKTAVAAALLNANTFLARQANDYFALPADANALLHTWSLSVEEQFYLVVPFVLLAGTALVGRRAGRGPALRRVGFVVLGVAGLGSFALFATTLAGRFEGPVTALGFSSPAAVGFYSAPTRAWEFIAGAALAVAAQRVATWPRGVRSALGVVGLVSVVAAAVLFTESSGLSAALMVVPVVGTVLLIASGTGGATAAGGLLGTRPLVVLGDLSYGWYLFHWPLIVFAESNIDSIWAVLAAAVLSLALAGLAKRTIEDRFRYDDRWRGSRVLLLAAVCVAVPVVAGLGSVVADRALSVDDLELAGARHIDSEGCNRRFDEWVSIDDPGCTWAVEDSRGTIVLIGDSHASMWSEATIAAGNELGYDVSIATMSGCPMVGRTVRRADGEGDVECQRFIEQYVAEIAELQPDLVLIGTGSVGVLGVEDGDPWLDRDGEWVNDPESIAQIWERGLGDTLDQLGAADVRVALFNDVPYHQFTTATCGRLRYMIDPAGCSSTRALVDVEADRAPSLAVEGRLDGGSELVSTIDPVPWLCADDECSTYLDGTWMYRDGDHLSVAASTALADRLRAQLVVEGL